MKQIAEENVYEETTPTEDVAAAKKEEASTVLGKFKDVDALARAYGSLQAEFTRRSQRLKELEREAEKRKRVEDACEERVEKLRKNARAHRAAAREFDEFLSDVGQPLAEIGEETTGAFEPSSVTVTDAETTPEETGKVSSGENEAVTDKAENVGSVGEKESILHGASTVGAKEISSVALGGESLSSDELYEKVCQDEALRLRIIGEYLSSIRKSEAPLTLGGAMTPLTPPKRARTIGTANAMALQYFKTTTQE